MPPDFKGLGALAKAPAGPATPLTPQVDPHKERVQGAVSELMSALKGGDVAAATEAFTAAVRACGDYSEDEALE